MLVRQAGASLGVEGAFSDDTLAYFLERLSPFRTRQALVKVLRRAKRNKVFENVVRIGIALDGTGLGRTTRQPCSLCHPQRNGQGEIIAHTHHIVLGSVVGAGIVLPFDVEPIVAGENELTAAKRLLPRIVQGLGRRFADYLVLDSLYAGAPFVTLALAHGLDVIVGLKANMSDLFDHARARFEGQPPTDSFDLQTEHVELWDAEDVEASQTLPWPSVRVLRSRRTRRGRKRRRGRAHPPPRAQQPSPPHPPHLPRPLPRAPLPAPQPPSRYTAIELFRLLWLALRPNGYHDSS